MKSRVVVKSCIDYNFTRVEASLKSAMALLGGFSRFFKPGQSVLVKPNLLTDSRPEEGITTHPVFVRAVVRMFKGFGLRTAIADIPGNYRLETNLKQVYETTGMRAVAEEEGADLLMSSTFIEEDGIIFSSWVREFDHIVSLPKLKTHSLMTLTGAVKNVFGLTPRLYRVSLHKKFTRPEEFAKVLVDVYKKCAPTVSIIDSIVAMEGNGPAHSGILKSMGFIGASSDGFALDSVLASVMGLNPGDIPTNREGASRGLGVIDLSDIEISGDRIADFKKSDFKLPPAHLIMNMPKSILKKALGRFAEFRPKVDNQKCNGCRICVENCPLSAIDIRDKKARIDYSKCVDCFCCLEVCPAAAMRTKEGPLIRVLRLLEKIAKFKRRFERTQIKEKT